MNDPITFPILAEAVWTLVIGCLAALGAISLLCLLILVVWLVADGWQNRREQRRAAAAAAADDALSMDVAPDPWSQVRRDASDDPQSQL